MTGTARCWFNMALFAAGIALAQRSTFAASDWEIIKVSGHDYLSVDNISRFYGFPAGVAAAGEKSQLDAVKNPLEFVSGSREAMRSEEHTSELQSRLHLVCRLLLEKKN